MRHDVTLIGLGLLAGSLALLAWARSHARQAQLGQRLAALAAPAGKGSAPTIPPRTGWLGWVERLLTTGQRDRAELTMALHNAGYYQASAVALFAVLRLAAALLGASTAALFFAGAGHGQGLVALYAAAGAAAGFLAAKTMLRARASAGTRQMQKEMPFLLDMLLLLLESGISLDQSFRYLAQQQVGGITRTRRTVRVLVDDLQKGMGHDQALDRWADRLGVFGARDLATLFKQSLLYGTEVGPALRDYVHEFADRRMSTARASVGRQTTMMTMVMVVFLMPAVMIMLAGPAVVAVKTALARAHSQAVSMPYPHHKTGAKP